MYVFHFSASPQSRSREVDFTKVVAKAVPDGEVGDEDQHEKKLEAESLRVN